MNLPRLLAALALPLLVGGCASVSVTDVRHDDASVPATRPAIIYVALFDTERGEFNVDRVADELADFKKNLAVVLQESLVNQFVKSLGVATQPVNAPPASEKGWLVVGRFTRVNQGSRALRMFVGFGAGGTKMETSVRVYDLAATPDRLFLNFETTGGSGAEPGGMPGGVASVASAAAGHVGKGVTEDCSRTARMITATLSEYMALQGWILPEDALTPKRK
jgi:hypothetical protein